MRPSQEERLASPGNGVSIDWSAEKEQAARAGVERDKNGHKHALAGSENPASRAKRDAPWYIREIGPV